MKINQVGTGWPTPGQVGPPHGAGWPPLQNYFFSIKHSKFTTAVRYYLLYFQDIICQNINSFCDNMGHS